MPRVPVLVRDAVADDEPALNGLLQGLPSDVPDAADDVGVAAALRAPTDDPRRRALVAVLDGRVIGCALLCLTAVTPLELEPAVVVTHLAVDQRFTRHGAGRALIEAGVGWAEAQGIGRFFVATAVDDRGTNRFLARLGLTQVALLRGTSVTALRARLPHVPSMPVRTSRRTSRHVGQVVAARRYQRQLRGGGAAT